MIVSKTGRGQTYTQNLPETPPEVLMAKGWVLKSKLEVVTKIIIDSVQDHH